MFALLCVLFAGGAFVALCFFVLCNVVTLCMSDETAKGSFQIFLVFLALAFSSALSYSYV